MNNPLCVFTKSWRCSIEELGEKLSGWGLNGVELPVRSGFAVNPENMTTALPLAVKTLARYGLRIYSIAGQIEPAFIEACGSAEVPMIRICVTVDAALGYFATVRKLQTQIRPLIPLLERHGVTIGLQNHAGNEIGSALGIRHAIGEFDRRHVVAVLDPAHCALAGEHETMAIDIAWSHLAMVNLKNAFHVRSNGPEAEAAEWRTHWTTGRHGLTSWNKTVAELQRRGYEGPICLSAEYSSVKSAPNPGAEVDRLIAEDVAFARTLMSSTDGR